METEILAIAISATINGLVLAVDHYWPREKPLPTVIAYIHGVATITAATLALFAFWDWWHPYPGSPFVWAAAGLIANVAAAGLVVIALYHRDEVAALKEGRDIAEQSVEVLRNER